MNKLIILLLTSFYLNTLNSQGYSSTIGLVGGYAEEGYAISVNYSYYTNKTTYFQSSIYFSNSIDKQQSLKIPYNIFTVNAGLFKSLFNNRLNTFSFNIGAGPLGGYEIINNGNNELDNGGLVLSKSKFIYGGFISSDTDFFINRKLSLVVKLSQFFHANSDLGQFTFFVGGGLRYFIF